MEVFGAQVGRRNHETTSHDEVLYKRRIGNGKEGEPSAFHHHEEGEKKGFMH